MDNINKFKRKEIVRINLTILFFINWEGKTDQSHHLYIHLLATLKT